MTTTKGAPRCACCGAAGARPMEGHTTPLCGGCDAAWLASAERARAATARADFVERPRREIGGGR